MLEYCPVAQSPKGRVYHDLLHHESWEPWMLAFMVPSMNCSSPVPAAFMQSQTMTLPTLSFNSSPRCRHTCLTISKPNKFILVSSWKYSYSLRHLYVEQQFLFSDPQRVLCHEVPWWTSSDQYERVRVIKPNLTHLLIHSWDLVTLTSHMTPGRENG